MIDDRTSIPLHVGYHPPLTNLLNFLSSSPAQASEEWPLEHHNTWLAALSDPEVPLRLRCPMLFEPIIALADPGVLRRALLEGRPHLLTSDVGEMISSIIYSDVLKHVTNTDPVHNNALLSSLLTPVITVSPRALLPHRLIMSYLNSDWEGDEWFQILLDHLINKSDPHDPIDALNVEDIVALSVLNPHGPMMPHVLGLLDRYMADLPPAPSGAPDRVQPHRQSVHLLRNMRNGVFTHVDPSLDIIYAQEVYGGSIAERSTPYLFEDVMWSAFRSAPGFAVAPEVVALWGARHPRLIERFAYHVSALLEVDAALPEDRVREQPERYLRLLDLLCPFLSASCVLHIGDTNSHPHRPFLPLFQATWTAALLENAVAPAAAPSRAVKM